MTMRKIWLTILTLVAVISVGVNAFILSSLTDNYFVDYLTASYENHVTQIVEYTKKSLLNNPDSYEQMAIELEAHLDDPVVQIKLYKPTGELVVDVKDESHPSNTMMGRGMMFSRTEFRETVDQYDVMDQGIRIGILNITRQSSPENSVVAQLFKSELLKNSLISIAVALKLAFLIGLYVSSRMSKALKETADAASAIELGGNFSYKMHYIKEINQIRTSLEELNTRLKLKQKSRKVLIDQMVHQARTPLTILKFHLEALEDGLIEFNEDEKSVCHTQIDTLNQMISNMSGLIDAGKEVDPLKIETFELHLILKQIVRGLKTQFDKKHIGLDILSSERVMIQTDKDLLSQMIYNLLTNAYKYTEAHGHVTISYRTTEDQMILTIEDTGIGIENKELDKIFQAYYRIDRDSDTPGEGIGLYVVKENVRALNGLVEVNSEVGKGSSFMIKLPLKR
jgi:signal transduction histidine kinase